MTGQGFGGVQIPGAKAPWYNLKQINFHAKSEHTLRGKHFPIEVQLVHQASSIESPMVGNEQVTVSFFVESDSPPEVVENFPGRRLDSRRKRDKAMASGASATKGAGKLRQGQGQKARETSLVQEKTLSAGKAGMFLREGSSGLPEIVVNEGGALQEVLEAILFQPLQPDVIDSAWFGDQLQPWDMNVGMDAAPALKMALLNGQAVVANTALFLTDPAPGYTKALHIRVKVWPWWQAGAGGMLASGKYMAPGIGEKGFNADFQHFVAKPPPVFLTSENVFLDVLAPLKFGAFLDGGTFFKYSGSETLPPCLENVLWLVRREPIKASVSQVRNLFYRLYTMSAANGNYRTVMPINARIIEVLGAEEQEPPVLPIPYRPKAVQGPVEIFEGPVSTVARDAITIAKAASDYAKQLDLTISRGAMGRAHGFNTMPTPFPGAPVVMAPGTNSDPPTAQGGALPLMAGWSPGGPPPPATQVVPGYSVAGMNGWGTMTTPPPTPVPGLDIGALALGVPVPGDVWFTTPPPLPAYSALAPFADMAPTMAPGPHHLPEGHFATGIVPPKPVPHLLAKAPAGAPGPALPLVSLNLEGATRQEQSVGQNKSRPHLLSGGAAGALPLVNLNLRSGTRRSEEHTSELQSP